ncbi:MAG TPA: hypothetical protein VN795_01690, partial [Stellaceae bacterium]|nr:hypothetical protein [Stellaceae bacterium]
NSFQARLQSGRQGEERHFEQVASAFGAHGENVRNAADLDAAIDRCLAALKAGRSAVLVAQVTPL